MSFVTAGYWSGYLSGLLVGIGSGWVLSIMQRDNFKEVRDDLKIDEKEESGDDESLEMNVTEAVTVENDYSECTNKVCRECVTNFVTQNELQDAPEIQSTSSDLNVIYFRLTDASLAKILQNTNLTNISESSFSGKVVDSDDDAGIVDEKEETTSFLPSPGSSPRSDETNIAVDEMTGIFEEEDRIKSRSREETLDVGRKMPTRPVAFLTSIGGGYATMNQIETMGKAHTEYKEATLSRSDEMEIIHAFRGIIGQSYYDAQGMVKSQGYTLHPLYVGCSNIKRPSQFYSATTLGVRIKDENFDSGIPSVHAVITEIVDVGGIDRGDRGNRGN